MNSTDFLTELSERATSYLKQSHVTFDDDELISKYVVGCFGTLLTEDELLALAMSVQMRLRK